MTWVHLREEPPLVPRPSLASDQYIEDGFLIAAHFVHVVGESPAWEIEIAWVP